MGSCDMPVNYPQVGYVDSSGMGRLLGAAAKAEGRGSSRDVTGQGRDKAGTWCFSQTQPHRERGLQRDGQSRGTPSYGQWDPAEGGREEGPPGALGQLAVV